MVPGPVWELQNRGRAKRARAGRRPQGPPPPAPPSLLSPQVAYLVNRVLTKVENDALEPFSFIWFLSSQTGPGTTSEASRPYVSYGFLTSILHSCKSGIELMKHMVNRKLQKVKNDVAEPFVFLSQMHRFRVLGPLRGPRDQAWCSESASRFLFFAKNGITL